MYWRNTYTLMLIEPIKVNNGVALGIKIDMEHAPLLLIKADLGFVMCGYLDVSTANKLGDAAVKVKGVRTFDDVLNAKVSEISENAKELGITDRMTGQEALELMFER